MHATLRTALNTAVKRRLIPWNPALHVERPTAERAQTLVWTSEQLGRFLDHQADHRLYALIHVVAPTGMRRGEALGLRWSDLDLEQALLSVTVDVLRRHRSGQAAERLAAGPAWVDSSLCFTDPTGAPLGPDYVSKLFATMTNQAGVPRIRLHDLRHTSASLALAAGLPMKVVSDRLGHSTTAITADLYTHVVPAVAREAAEQLAASITRHRQPTADSNV